MAIESFACIYKMNWVKCGDYDMRKILLITEETFGAMFSQLLQEQGYEVNVVEAYRDIVKVYGELSRIEYDMVIPTNLALVTEDIIKIVPEIKRRFPKIKVICCSGYNESEFVSSLQQCGIDDFFYLPFDKEILLNRIKELFQCHN
jgi:DNA-binding NtrC family response regulator